MIEEMTDGRWRLCLDDKFYYFPTQAKALIGLRLHQQHQQVLTLTDGVSPVAASEKDSVNDDGAHAVASIEVAK